MSSSNSNIRDSPLTVDSTQRIVSNCSSKFSLFVLFVNILNASGEVSHCDFNCMHPRRPETEALFNAVGHHERSADLKEMMDKIDVRVIFIDIIVVVFTTSVV
jgi:hypothetical protein